MEPHASGLWAVILGWSAAAVWAAGELPLPLATVRHDELREVSGLAASHRRPGLVWAINDSGHPPILYGIHTNGDLIARVELASAHNNDWEDLASFLHKGQSWLLVADSGDNDARRDNVTLWVVAEPDCTGEPPRSIRPALTIVVSYLDGPRDVESVAVDEPSGWVLLFSKRDRPPRLYTVQLPASPWTGQVVTAQARLTAELRTWAPSPSAGQQRLSDPITTQPTAMDYDAVGRRLVVLTYTDAWLWTLPATGRWAQIESANWRKISLPSPETGWLRRREAIAWTCDRSGILLTTEGRHPPLVRIEPPADPSPDPVSP